MPGLPLGVALLGADLAAAAGLGHLNFLWVGACFSAISSGGLYRPAATRVKPYRTVISAFTRISSEAAPTSNSCTPGSTTYFLVAPSQNPSDATASVSFT